MYTEEIDFPFLRLLFECRVSGPLLYFTSRRGESIKGLIADEMKKLFPCSFQLPCEQCNIIDDPRFCEYVRFFRYDLCQWPFSYVIVPPLNNRSVYHTNEKFSFEIRLFGECATFQYLIQYLAPAIEQGGLLTGIGNWYKEQQHFGRFQLSRIYAWKEKRWINVFKEEDGFLVDNIIAESFYDQFGSENKAFNGISFYTPFCLKKNKSILPEPSPADLVYFSVMRLRTIHGNWSLKVQDDIFEKIEGMEADSFHFEKVFVAKNLSYFIGHMQFKNLDQALLPVLQAGGFCHIGKSITQGYGGFFLISSKA